MNVPAAHQWALRVAVLTSMISLSHSIVPQPKTTFDGKALTVPIGAEATYELYHHWVDQAFSGLFAAVAEKRLKKLPSKVASELEQCSKSADSVFKHARCVSRVLKHRETDDHHDERHLKAPRKHEIRRQQLQERHNEALRLRGGAAKVQEQDWVGRFRVNTARRKRQAVVSKSRYSLLDRYSGMTALGAVGNTLTRAALAMKNKTSVTSWQTAVNKMRFVGQKRRDMKEKREKSSGELSIIERLATRGLAKPDIDDFSVPYCVTTFLAVLHFTSNDS